MVYAVNVKKYKIWFSVGYDKNMKCILFSYMLNACGIF